LFNPKYIMIALTDKCDLNCPYCFYKGSLEDHRMSKENKKLLIQILKDYLSKLKDKNRDLTIGFTGGESSIYLDDLLDITESLALYKNMRRNMLNLRNLNFTLFTHGQNEDRIKKIKQRLYSSEYPYFERGGKFTIKFSFDLMPSIGNQLGLEKTSLKGAHYWLKSQSLHGDITQVIGELNADYFYESYLYVKENRLLEYYQPQLDFMLEDYTDLGDRIITQMDLIIMDLLKDSKIDLMFHLLEKFIKPEEWKINCKASIDECLIDYDLNLSGCMNDLKNKLRPMKKLKTVEDFINFTDDYYQKDIDTRCVKSIRNCKNGSDEVFNDKVRKLIRVNLGPVELTRRRNS